MKKNYGEIKSLCSGEMRGNSISVRVTFEIKLFVLLGLTVVPLYNGKQVILTQYSLGHLSVLTILRKLSKPNRIPRRSILITQLQLGPHKILTEDLEGGGVLCASERV